MGNPSDGFNGKTISLSIRNFWAEVTIAPSERLRLNRNPLNDPTEFGSLEDLHGISCVEGYQGGLRLMQATCKRFYQYCFEHGIAISRRNFSLSYDTNIPRQVGLAGSSAIVTCTLHCLMAFFNLTDSDIPKELQVGSCFVHVPIHACMLSSFLHQVPYIYTPLSLGVHFFPMYLWNQKPQFVLDVEMSELGINAGLQDRVIQKYNGLVYMDFDKKLFAEQGHGNYINLDSHSLPDFWLAYLADPSDSGRIHNDVRQRFIAGDPETIR